ncbi:MAG: hypothetical protein IAG10_31350 [Planctomycetaceae bacterium]|nr:hypothetical protein [Planctomycetaceae bacterium]
MSDNIEFDFTPQLGVVGDRAYIEIADPGALIRLRINKESGGSMFLTVESSGYTPLGSIAQQPLTANIAHHVQIAETAEGITILLNGTRIAGFAGKLRLNSVLRSSVASDRAPLYDDFNDNSIDSSRWSTAGDVEERVGRLHLWLRHNGNLQNSIAETQDRPSGMNIHGFKLNADRTAGTVNGGQAEAWVGITNDTDYVRMRWLSDVNQLIIQTGGAYGDNTHRWDPDSPGPAETPDGPFEIRERNGNIEFLHNSAVQFTLQNQSIRSGSWFEAVAYGQNGEGGPLNKEYELMIDDLQLYAGATHLAELELDNVTGTFALPADSVATPYDNFDDNSLNHEKFQVSGTVEERESALKLSLFRQGEPVSGYVSTNGNPDGTNLRGFKLNANRTTEPKKLSSDDARARMRLTNGVDFIEIEWKFQSHIFRINTAGAYGVQHVDIPVPAAEVPDGPLEVRERDGNIEVLHNGQVKLTLLNQTVRAGSFFTFETDGLITGGDPVDNPPQDFDAFIDDLVFYRDPLPNTLQVTPTLKPDSDMGASNTDHVTNQLTLDFDWAAGPAGTKYQWREGELEEDGSISFGAWSAPQSEPTATVNLPGASVHVFSVRPIDAQGLVGKESSRGVQVDVINPTSTDFQAVRDTQLRLEFSMSEPVVATLSNVVVRDSSNQIITPLGLEGSGTTTLAVVLPSSSTVDTYSVTLTGATDVAGNLLADAIITPINDPPAIGAFDTTLTYTANGPAMLLDPNATVTDVDKSRFNGDVLMIGVTDNADEATDRLEIRPVTRLIGVSESDLTFRGTTVASFTGGIGVSPLIITFNANATESAVQAVLRNVTYRSVSANPSTLPRTVRVILTDGTGTPSNLATKTINFAPSAAPLADMLLVTSLSAPSIAGNQPSVSTVSPLRASDSEYRLSFTSTPFTSTPIAGAANTGNDQNREYLLSFVNDDDSERLKKRRRRL